MVTQPNWKYYAADSGNASCNGYWRQFWSYYWDGLKLKKMKTWKKDKLVKGL